jgi:hypothetical protein
MIGILTIIIIIFSLFSGCIFSGSDDDSDKDSKPEGFKTDDLSVPDAVNINIIDNDYTKPDAVSTGREVAFKYQSTWAFSYNTVYTVYGGLMQLWMTNLGESEMFVYQFGISPEWAADNYSVPSEQVIGPDEKAELGYLAFPGPSEPGSYKYMLRFGILARYNSSSDWFDWGIVGNKSYEITVQSTPISSELQGYEQENNNEWLYNKINELIDPMQKDVRDTAVTLAKEYEGMYNIYQLCAIFEYVKSNVSYVNDPRGDENYWSTPEETMDLAAGDCEDQAILFAGLISAIDGTVRIGITDSHAFALVYIGSTPSVRDNILKTINTYYGTELKYAWMQDELGYWMVIDTINAMHPGGLPLGAVPLRNDSGSNDELSWPWDYNDTETLHIIDVI